jgi:lipopolysaccharide transport system ATP-binding protein
MSGDVIIRAEALGKKYVIGHQGQREDYVALRDVIARNARGAVRATRDLFTGRQMVTGDEVEDFWALKDVNFDIKSGEVVGIVGRNGAGKSTLLKILSRITEPSSGRVEIRGRVASLLEVGTGFHPELTGRENIFLNGAILGMGRAEIRRKFDEVLAVGDIKFQNKCLGKIETIGKGGRTVIFVSHNMSAVRRLCHRAILFSQGTLVQDGETDSIVARYLDEMRPEGGTADSIARLIEGLPADPTCRLLSVGLRQDGVAPARVESAKPLEIVFEYEVLQETYGFHAFFRLMDNEETVLFESFDCAESDDIPTVAPGRYRSVAVIPANLLGAKRYEIALDLGIVFRNNCLPEPIRIPFEVELTGRINQCFVGYVSPGKVLPSIQWKIEKV